MSYSPKTMTAIFEQFHFIASLLSHFGDDAFLFVSDDQARHYATYLSSNVFHKIGFLFLLPTNTYE